MNALSSVEDDTAEWFNCSFCGSGNLPWCGITGPQLLVHKSRGKGRIARLLLPAQRSPGCLCSSGACCDYHTQSVEIGPPGALGVLNSA